MYEILNVEERSSGFLYTVKLSSNGVEEIQQYYGDSEAVVESANAHFESEMAKRGKALFETLEPKPLTEEAAAE